MLWEGLLALASRHPDLRVAIVRRTRKSMTNSVLELLETQVWGPGHPWITTKGHRSHWTHLKVPNGAEFAFCGLDDPLVLYSTEWHIVWVNEAQQLTKRKLESLHRGLRAPGGPNWHLLIGDFNPPASNNWICQRGE